MLKLDKNNYNRNGFLILKDFFDKSDVAKVLDDAKYVFYRQFVNKGYTTLPLQQLSEDTYNEYMYRLFAEDVACLANCGKQAQHLISLHRLALNQKIVDVLTSLGLTSPVISTRPVMFFNHPKLAKQKVYHQVDAHQDWRSMQGSLNSIVIWVPLVDVDKALGALEVIPGSHLEGLQADEMQNGFGMVDIERAADKFISVELQQGDVLVFSSFLVHQSGNNITNNPRWSCHFRYNDLNEETFINRSYAHAYIYKPVEELITPGFPAIEEVKKVFR